MVFRKRNLVACGVEAGQGIMHALMFRLGSGFGIRLRWWLRNFLGRMSGRMVFIPQRDPSVSCLRDVAFGLTIVELKHLEAIVREEGDQCVPINQASEGDAMIAPCPGDIMNVTADGAGPQGLQALFVVEKTQMVLNLSMAKVMPIPDRPPVKSF